MAAIIIPRDWRVQPRGPVEPDLAHPLNDTLAALWTPSMAFTDASGLNAGVRSAPSVAAVESGSRFGKTVNFGQNGLELVGEKPVAPPAAGFSSIIIGGRPPTNQSWCIGVRTPYGSFRKWNGVYTVHSANTHYTQIATATQWPVEPAIVVAGRGPGTSSSAVRFRVNGANLVNNSNNGSSAYTTTTYQVMQSVATDRSAATYWAAPTALVGLWSRYFTDEEALELNANPWQIFKPRRKVLYFDVASAVPTLSLPGVTGIQATQATPKVTLTF